MRISDTLTITLSMKKLERFLTGKEQTLNLPNSLYWQRRLTTWKKFARFVAYQSTGKVIYKMHITNIPNFDTCIRFIPVDFGTMEDFHLQGAMQRQRETLLPGKVPFLGGCK